MGIKISDWIQRVSKGWVALLTLLIFLLFTALVLPDQSSRSSAATNDAGSPDMSFFYTADDLYQFADAYGAAGRAAYIRARFSFDLIWPLVYTLFLATGISWTYRRAFPPGSLWQRMNLVPVVACLFDYLENISTSLVMFRFPSPTPVIGSLAAIFTPVKWILVGGSFALLTAGAGIMLWQWVRAKK